MRDLHNNVAPQRSISPISVADNTAQVGQIIDHQGFDGAEYLIALGSLADINATFTVLLEHGDAANLSDAAAVPDTMLLGTEAEASFTFADDDSIKKLGYVGDKGYTRLTITPAANTGAAVMSAVCVLGFPRHAPTPTL